MNMNERPFATSRNGRRRILLIAALTVVAVAAGKPSMARLVPKRTARAEGPFIAHAIDTGLTGGYQVVVTDMNHDGKPDILAVASGLHEVDWYENPTWTKHVLVSGINAPINAAAYDVDGDGIPEIALAHEFSNVHADARGALSILTHTADVRDPWSRRDIDHVPTSHRVRFVDIDGKGTKVLVNFPLIGAKAVAPQYQDHVPFLMYRPGAWARDTISVADEGVVHGIWVDAWDRGAREAVLSASFRGVFLHRYVNGRWLRSPVVSGDPTPWPKSGASDVVVGHQGAERFIATTEPWHGNEVVVYRESRGGWSRHVIDSTLVDGHSLIVADIDGNGHDEIFAGERGGHRSVYRYRLTDPGNDVWTKSTLDNGGMAAAGCASADLNGDHRVDIVCIGTATANLKWYENHPTSR